MKSKILKLNASWINHEQVDWREAIKNIFSQSAFPIDISHPQNEDGSYILEEVEYMQLVKEWDQWCALPIRPHDDFIQTSKGPIRLPSVVVCAEFNKVIYQRAIAPTKKAIWERDNWTCGYSGVKLTKETATVDHIEPKSRGGKDTWENLISCHVDINRKKGDKTPREAGLKLLWKPAKPKLKNVLIFDCVRPEWIHFLPK